MESVTPFELLLKWKWKTRASMKGLGSYKARTAILKILHTELQRNPVNRDC